MGQPLGVQIKARRLALKLSQTELASKAGITQPFLSRVESGVMPVSHRLLPSLCDALQVQIVHGPDGDTRLDPVEQQR